MFVHGVLVQVILMVSSGSSAIVSWDDRRSLLDKRILKSVCICTRHILSSKKDKKTKMYFSFLLRKALPRLS